MTDNKHEKSKKSPVNPVQAPQEKAAGTPEAKPSTPDTKSSQS
ncbi:hypothetical protein [Maricaulis sp.]